MHPTILFINQFDSVFTNSFKHTANVLYRVEFHESFVLNVQKKLWQLEENFIKGVNSQRHVGLQITLDDIKCAKSRLDLMIDSYLDYSGRTKVPENLKVFQMSQELRNSVESSQKEIIVTSVSEILADAGKMYADELKELIEIRLEKFPSAVKQILVPSSKNGKLTKKEKDEKMTRDFRQQMNLKMIRKYGT